MYSKKVLELAKSLANDGVMLHVMKTHPMRHVESGKEGQIFGTDFINERAPKVVTTLRLFKETILPVLNTTIQNVMTKVQDLKTELNEQDLIKIYEVSEKYVALERQDYIYKENVSGFNELAFKDMVADDVVEMSTFGNGVLETMSIITPTRTEWIYNTYIKNMDIHTCKKILKPSASVDALRDRLDVIIVGLRILNDEIVGKVFTPGNDSAKEALRQNVRILINKHIDFVELFNSESKVLGSVCGGKISLLPAGVAYINDDEGESNQYTLRGLALSHDGYFTYRELEKDNYYRLYENHLAIRALQNKSKMNGYKKDIIKGELIKLKDLGSDFTSRVDGDSLDGLDKYVEGTEEIGDIKKYITYLFQYHLFYSLPLSFFMNVVDDLLKCDHKLSMNSAVVLATAEMIVDDIMVGIRHIEVGD